jgi:hypothetical protein
MTPSDNSEPATTAGSEPHSDHHNQASRDIYDATRDINQQVDNRSGQNVVVNVGHLPRGQAGRVPGPETGTRRGHRRSRPRFRIAAATGMAGLLLGSIGIYYGYGTSSSPKPAASQGAQAPATVQMVGNDVLFSDPGVARELRRQGLVVKQTLPGSRTACTDTRVIADYDFSDTSAEASSCFKSLALRAGKLPDVYNPYAGLMVIITYSPVVTLLKGLGVASEAYNSTTVKNHHKVKNYITVFDVAKYLKVFASGKRWADIPGNTTYPSRNRILLWTTNPKQSNLGGMLADIAYAAQAGGDPPTSIGPDDKRVPVIRSLFTELGELQDFSVTLLNQFLAGGMGEYPMAMVYESQYLSTRLTGIATDPSLTVMYPTPDVSTQDALVAWTPAGKRLIEALKSPQIAALEKGEGYRTAADKAEFVRYMASRGLFVPDLNQLEVAGVQFSNLPTADVLTKLINAVAASQPG